MSPLSRPDIKPPNNGFEAMQQLHGSVPWDWLGNALMYEWISTSKSVSMKALTEQGMVGGVLVRLMMVLQDCGFANYGMRMLGKPSKKKKQGDVKRAVGRYFLRLQISHTYEAMKIIKEIRDNDALTGLLMACDRRTKKAYEKLEAELGTDDYKLIKTIRNKVGFHYDPTMVRDSLKRIEKRRKRQTSKRKKFRGVRRPIDIVQLEVSTYMHRSKYVPWEAVENDIIMHEIFGLPESDTYDDDKKLDAASDEIVLRLHEIQKTFGFFAANFVAKYVRT